MIENAPLITAIALAVGGSLLVVSCLFSRVSSLLGIPAALVFLAVGMLAGSDGPGGIYFDRFDVAYMFGTLALVVILFSGGLDTPLRHIRGAAGPAIVLATVGVIGVAGMTAVGARLLGLSWPEALLVGAIVSSTDAAAVFAILEGVPLRSRVGLTIELESGLNDPVAIILTAAMAAGLIGSDPIGWSLVPSMIVQLAIGGTLGVAIGYLGRALLRGAQLSTMALYPALSLGLALLAYGVPTWLGGSGFLGTYVAGIVLGNGQIPYRLPLRRFHHSAAWLAQISMFLMLGLLVFPSQLPAVATTGLLLALYLAVVARPVVVTLCLWLFRFDWREILCISWLGLRGAVPIVLATVAVLAAPGQGQAMQEVLNAFDLVFFVVVVGAIIPGATVRWVIRVLKVDDHVVERAGGGAALRSDKMQET